MALSEQEKNDYIQNVVLENFKTLKHQPIFATLFGTSYGILDTTDETKRIFGLNSLGLKDLNRERIMLACKIQMKQATGAITEWLDDIENICQKIIELLQIVISEKRSTNYISVITRQGKFTPRIINLLPIFHPCGEVVAVQSTSSEYKIFNVQEYFKIRPLQRWYPLSLSNLAPEFPIKLTTRQHEIVYFLSHGFSQNDISYMLRIHRGTVSKIIADYLCPKFGLNDANTEKLLIKAKAMNYHKYLPVSFCQPCIISIDPYIIDKYFDGESRLYPHWNK